MKNYWQERRAILVKILGGKCVECGDMENLEFDHIDPKKKCFTISKTWKKLAVVLQELEKCQLLCNKCHKKKSYKRRKHGTSTMHKYGGCRCKVCVGFYNKYMREYKRKVRSRVA